MDEEEDMTPYKTNYGGRAKSSLHAKRGRCKILNPRFRPNSSNFMYRPLRTGVENRSKLEMLDTANSDMIFASSSVARPSTTTFSHYRAGTHNQ